MCPFCTWTVPTIGSDVLPNWEELQKIIFFGKTPSSWKFWTAWHIKPSRCQSRQKFSKLCSLQFYIFSHPLFHNCILYCHSFKSFRHNLPIHQICVNLTKALMHHRIKSKWIHKCKFSFSASCFSSNKKENKETYVLFVLKPGFTLKTFCTFALCKWWGFGVKWSENKQRTNLNLQDCPYFCCNPKYQT